MMTLGELQQAMQRDIMGKTNTGDSLLAEPCTGSRGQRLDVYRKAYLLRLTEFLANDFAKLRRYLGETRFNDMSRAYAARHPSDTPNARWFSRHLPDFLATTQPYHRHPELSELARLEQALNDAFDGPDTPALIMADVVAMAPEEFAASSFELAPTMRRFAVTTNVASLWSCLKCEEAPPCAIDLDAPSQILVWRQKSGSRFRILGEEEAMAIDCMSQGLSFAAVCEMIAAFDPAGDAAMRAASYLRGWLEAEIIVRLRPAPAK